MSHLTNLHFDVPLVLLALIPILFLVPVIAGPRLRAMRRIRRVAVLAIRSLIIALLIGALAEPVLVRSHTVRSVVFVIDVSDSMAPQARTWAREWVDQALQEMGPESRSAVVEVGAHAQLTSPGTDHTPPPRDGTNLEEALRLAQSVLPVAEGGRTEIVLLTDGWENLGQVLSDSTASSDARGSISYVSIEPLSLLPNDVAIVSADVAPILRAGDVADLSIVLASSTETRTSVRLQIDGQLVVQQDAALEPGMNYLSLFARLPSPGFHDLRVEIVPERDARPENNNIEAVTVAKDPGRVLILENQAGEGAGLATALTTDGLNVETWPVARIPPSASALSEFDVAVLVNTPATSLTLDQQQTLQQFPHDLGRGLLVAGGPLSFSPGGYKNTLLEELLPVSATPPEQPRPASISLFLVLDKSSSMTGTRLNEPTKLDMAREAAIQAVELLRQDDVIGVVGFNTEFEWVVPATRISSSAERADVEARIRSMQPGGGTAFSRALSAAYQAALQTDTRLKHIVLLTDGQASDRGYDDLVRQMREDNITFSTVAVGSDADRNLLAELARLGSGRSYFTERSSQIPQIAGEEISILTDDALVEGDVSAHLHHESPVLRGLTGDLPALSGYVATTPRDRATIALETGRGDPLLAHWQYGRGRVVAWTSEAATGEWGSEWSDTQWTDATQFWGQVVRWSLPAPQQPDFLVTSTLDPLHKQVALTVSSIRDDGTFANFQDTRATVVLPDGTAREVRLQQHAPGAYERMLELDQPGVYRVLIRQHDQGRVVNEEMLGFAVPGSGPEYRTVGMNEELLSRLAEHSGGRELRDPGDVLDGPNGSVEERTIPLWPWFVGLAGLLLPLDVAFRRW